MQNAERKEKIAESSEPFRDLEHAYEEGDGPRSAMTAISMFPAGKLRMITRKLPRQYWGRRVCGVVRIEMCIH